MKMIKSHNSYKNLRFLFQICRFLKISSLKLLSQMNRNLVGSTYGRFCIKFPQIRMQLLYASYHISVHLAKRFQRRRFFRNRPTRNKNCLWQSCLLTNRDEMSNLYRGPSIDASYQVSVHLVKLFQRRRLWLP
jgi:hypothetical protein